MLRRARTGDAESLVEAVLDSMTELRQFMDWSHDSDSLTIAAQQERLRAIEDHWSAGEEFIWHIFREIDSEWRFAGTIGVRPRCPNPKGMDVGFWIRTEAAGQGLCTRACQMVTVVAFQDIHLERLQVGCDEANGASRRVIEKVGFHFEGRKRKELATPTEEMRRRGSLRTGHALSFALTDDDIGSLDWTAGVRAQLEIDG